MCHYCPPAMILILAFPSICLSQQCYCRLNQGAYLLYSPPCQGHFRAHLLEFMDHLQYSLIKRRITVWYVSLDFKVELKTLDVLHTATFVNVPDPLIEYCLDVFVDSDLA